MRAAKNAFQIYRILLVNGESMVFHVDFLHRKYADDSDDVSRSWGRYQSIATVGLDVIFTAKEVRSECVSGVGIDGKDATANIIFASEAAFLCSKGRSVGTGKRERDGFDIYFVITQSSDINKLKERCKNLMSDPVFAKSMKRIKVQFQEDQIAVEKAAKFLFSVSPQFYDKTDLAIKEISEKVCAFIDDLFGLTHHSSGTPNGAS